MQIVFIEVWMYNVDFSFHVLLKSFDASQFMM